MNINRQTTITERTMQPTAAKLIRWSGLAAMAAGIMLSGDVRHQGLRANG